MQVDLHWGKFYSYAAIDYSLSVDGSCMNDGGRQPGSCSKALTMQLVVGVARGWPMHGTTAIPCRQLQ